jgi:hypothetical protein
LHPNPSVFGNDFSPDDYSTTYGDQQQYAANFQAYITTAYTYNSEGEPTPAWRTYALPTGLLDPSTLTADHSVSIFKDPDGEVSMNRINGPSIDPLNLPRIYGGQNSATAVEFTTYNLSTGLTKQTYVVPGRLVH